MSAQPLVADGSAGNGSRGGGGGASSGESGCGLRASAALDVPEAVAVMGGCPIDGGVTDCGLKARPEKIEAGAFGLLMVIDTRYMEKLPLVFGLLPV
jgi:hypothetical protein